MASPTEPVNVPGRSTAFLWLVLAATALLLVANLALQWRQLADIEAALASDRAAANAAVSAQQLEGETRALSTLWRETQGAEPPDLGTLRALHERWRTSFAAADPALLAALWSDDPALAEAIGRIRAQRPEATSASAAVPLEILADRLLSMPSTAAHTTGATERARLTAWRQQHRLAFGLGVFLCALGAIFAVLALHLARRLAIDHAASEPSSGLPEPVGRESGALLRHFDLRLRRPLQALVGALGLMRDSHPSPRQSEQLRDANASAERLLATLDDMSDLTSLAAGPLALKPGPVELTVLLQQVESLMQPLASAKAMSLEVDVDPAVPAWTVADGPRLKQLLLMLLAGALACRAQGRVLLELSCLAGTPERLRFGITAIGTHTADDGADGERHPHRRQDDTAQTAVARADDARLGLAIADRLARALGGVCAFDDFGAKVLRLSFELPLVRPAVPNDAPPAQDGPEWRSLHVLVAEDHPVSRRYMAALLEQMRHRAHFVANGRHAVQAVQSQPFDLVLMDLHMPEVDGIEATVRIRALPDRAAATLPIIALTADALTETRERCMLVGMNDFLTKPVSLPDLAGALRRLYGSAVAQTPERRPKTAPAADAEHPLIDPAVLDRVRRDVDASRLGTLVEEFLAQGAQTVHRLRAAVRDGKPLALREEAHATCGVALNLGLTALAQTAQALHDGAAHLPAHEVAHLVARFESQLSATRNAAVEQGLAAPDHAG